MLYGQAEIGVGDAASAGAVALMPKAKIATAAIPCLMLIATMISSLEIPSARSLQASDYLAPDTVVKRQSSRRQFVTSYPRPQRRRQDGQPRAMRRPLGIRTDKMARPRGCFNTRVGFRSVPPTTWNIVASIQT